MAAFWPSRAIKKRLACSNETCACVYVFFVTVRALPHRHEVEYLQYMSLMPGTTPIANTVPL